MHTLQQLWACMTNFLVFLNMLMEFSLKVALITVHCSNHLFWFSRQNVALQALRMHNWRHLLADSEMGGADFKTLTDRDIKDLLPNFLLRKKLRALVNHVSMLIKSQSYIIDYIMHVFPVRAPKHVPPRAQNCDSLLTYATSKMQWNWKYFKEIILIWDSPFVPNKNNNYYF